MTDGLGILGAFVNDQLVAFPLGNRGDQFDRVLVLWRACKHRLHLYRASSKALSASPATTSGKKFLSGVSA